jgi:hypothetical protein
MKWTTPDKLECYVGDRVVAVVSWRELRLDLKLLPHIVVLEVTEEGWEDRENGFAKHDVELCCLESDLLDAIEEETK